MGSDVVEEFNSSELIHTSDDDKFKNVSNVLDTIELKYIERYIRNKKIRNVINEKK